MQTSDQNLEQRVATGFTDMPVTAQASSVDTGNLLRLPVVMKKSGLGRSTIYRRMKAGTFPKAVDNGSGVRWREADIKAWDEKLPYRGEGASR